MFFKERLYLSLLRDIWFWNFNLNSLVSNIISVWTLSSWFWSSDNMGDTLRESNCKLFSIKYIKNCHRKWLRTHNCWVANSHWFCYFNNFIRNSTVTIRLHFSSGNNCLWAEAWFPFCTRMWASGGQGLHFVHGSISNVCNGARCIN